MTPQDHNKTLGIIYGFMGGLLTVAAMVELVRVMTLNRELNRIISSSFLMTLIPIALVFTIFLLSTAYGIIKRKSWARISALISSSLFVWLFPLGTVLAVYTWWFMHSTGGRQLFSRSTTSD